MTKNMNESNKTVKNLAADRKKEAFLPILLATVCMSVALLAVIIDKFVYRFGGELLSPLLSQVIILLIPMYLCMLMIYPGKSPVYQLSQIGMARLRAEYIFFMIFTSLFLITTSLMLNIVFGGVYPISDGFTLLGTFTAGVGEYTVSYPYLIIVYALLPAIVEELLFRGLIYSLLQRVSESAAICISSLISATFAFSIGGFPAALFCALSYCFIRHTTRSLQACMIVHFVFNLYAIFAQTNLAKYFVSSQNLFLLVIVAITVWLICSALFFSESARVYRHKAERIKNGEEESELKKPDLKGILQELKAILSYRPTLVSTIILLTAFVAITIIGYFA